MKVLRDAFLDFHGYASSISRSRASNPGKVEGKRKEIEIAKSGLSYKVRDEDNIDAEWLRSAMK